MWLTKLFSTRLFHSGKIRSQVMSQRQSTQVFLWPLVKPRMGPDISREAEFTLLEIFIWKLPDPRTGALRNFGKKIKIRWRTGDVQLSGQWLEAKEENQYFAGSCQPDSVHLAFSSSGQPPLLPMHEYIILNNRSPVFLGPSSHSDNTQASLFWCEITIQQLKSTEAD